MTAAACVSWPGGLDVSHMISRRRSSATSPRVASVETSGTPSLCPMTTFHTRLAVGRSPLTSAAPGQPCPVSTKTPGAIDADELPYAGAAEQARRVAAREVSARELVKATLRRIERLDPR